MRKTGGGGREKEQSEQKPGFHWGCVPSLKKPDRAGNAVVGEGTNRCAEGKVERLPEACKPDNNGSLNDNREKRNQFSKVGTPDILEIQTVGPGIYGLKRIFYGWQS